jgi:hypothetical protein
MKDTDKKEIKIEFVEDDKASITVHNICIDCVIDKLKKITKQLIEDRDRIAEAVEDGCDDCCEAPEIDEEDLPNLLKKAPDLPSFDEAYSAYKRGVKTTKVAMDKYDVEYGTIPDSVGKVLSIMSSDEQIRNDMARLVSGYITNEHVMKVNSKKKKKK